MWSFYDSYYKGVFTINTYTIAKNNSRKPNAIPQLNRSPYWVTIMYTHFQLPKYYTSYFLTTIFFDFFVHAKYIYFCDCNYKWGTLYLCHFFLRKLVIFNTKRLLFTRELGLSFLLFYVWFLLFEKTRPCMKLFYQVRKGGHLCHLVHPDSLDYDILLWLLL